MADFPDSSHFTPLHRSGEKSHVLPTETILCHDSSTGQSDKSGQVEKVRDKQVLPGAQPAAGRGAAVRRCCAGWSSLPLGHLVLFSPVNCPVGEQPTADTAAIASLNGG